MTAPGPGGAVAAEDELALRNLVARYADAVCRRDADAWIATWAEDCVWDLGRGRVSRGRPQTLDLWLSSIAAYPWVAQLPASGTVETSGSGYAGWWYILELNHRADGSGVLHLGHYADTYARTGEGWRFAARRFHLIYRGYLEPGEVVPLPRPQPPG